MYAKWSLVLHSLSKTKLINIAKKETTRSDNDNQNLVAVEIA